MRVTFTGANVEAVLRRRGDGRWSVTLRRPLPLCETFADFRTAMGAVYRVYLGAREAGEARR